MTSDTPRASDEVDLPPAIELAWGLRDRPARGPKRGLTLERIVAAGMMVAKAEGLDAASMARVASELGVATMALYRYVGSKDELLELMVDAALGPAPGAHEPGDGWRPGLTRWTDAVRARYLAQPWALRVTIDSPPLGPNNLAWLEDAFSCMTDTPLREPEKLAAVMLLSGFVRNEARLTTDVAARVAVEGEPLGYSSMVSRLIDADRFPSITRALAGGVFDEAMDDPDTDYRFGRDRILDGLGAHMAARRPSRRRGSGRPTRG